MTPLEARRDTLYDRLEAGYVKIERGLREGADVTDWENLWAALLSEYEAVCTELMRDAAETRRRRKESAGQLAMVQR